MSLTVYKTFLKKIKSQAGFTLVELLIVIALIGIVSIPITASLIFGMKIFDSETAVDEVYQDQLSAFTEIKEALRSNPYAVIVTTTDNVDTLQIGADDTAIFYTLSQGNLVRITGQNNPETILCNHITAFELTNLLLDSEDKVTQLNLTLTTTIRNRTHSLSTEISLRRY